jgi:hypothetical protein
MSIFINMTTRATLMPVLVALFFLCGLLSVKAQMGMRWARQPDLAVVERFDGDGDGRLNEKERQAARKYVRDQRASQNVSTGTPPDVPIRSVLAADLRQSTAAAVPKNIDLYEETVLRTLYLRFPDPDWPAEMADFFKTDVEIPADLIVDGDLYPGVGVRFRGNSSYFMLGNSPKKSFSISIDYSNDDQRLYGYRTLDLLNSHADSSFLRTVLFSRISRRYIPAPKANFVRLVINGENWGVYINVQQFNNDFTKEWFGTRQGVRWKVPAGRNSDGGLTYRGPDPALYRRSFELNTKDTPEAWLDLIELCDILTNTPDSILEQRLSRVFDIDGALWFLALENVFIDSDGYISRGSDYYMYQDSVGRFHLITHDNNETFRFAGGGGPNGWHSSDPMLSPVGHEGNPSLPVISRLLNIPHLRARYLAHVRSLVNQWLDWQVIAPIAEEYRTLIAEEVRKDDKKIYGYDAFIASLAEDTGGYGRFGTPSLKRFVEERREFLLAHPEVGRQSPQIFSLQHRDPEGSEGMVVTARVSPGDRVDQVLLYYALDNQPVFSTVVMRNHGRNQDLNTGTVEFSGEIPPFRLITKVRYYVEARALKSLGTTAFLPENTEWGARSVRIGLTPVYPSAVVINEFLAMNTRSAADPQGEFDDWIELYNRSDSAVDLSGMYLSDRAEDPRKWRFPLDTVIPPRGFLLVWADEDDGEKGELHANFKLSGDGEQLLLVDTDARENRVLDTIEYGTQRRDVAYGRVPDGTGEFQSLYATPGRSNGK